METYTKFAVKGVTSVLFFSVIAAFLGYLVRIILARNLAVEDFGLFYSIFSFLTLIGLFKSFGFDKALIKFIPEFLHKKKLNLVKSSMIYVAVIQIITNSIIILFIFLFADYLSASYFQNSQASLILKLMAFAFFLDSFVLVLKFTFQGFRKMAYFSMIDFVRMGLITIAILIGLRMGYGLLSPAVAYIIVPIILILIFGYVLIKKVFRKFFSSEFVFNKPLLKRMSHYSMYIIFGSVGIIIMGSLDVAMLTYFSGLTAVALYSVALPTTRILTYFPDAIAKVLFPLTSDLWSRKKKKILEAGMSELYKYTAIILLPMVLVLFSFSDLVINVFFGQDYVGAANAMKILSIGMLFASLGKLCNNFFMGIGKPQISSRAVYSAAIFNFIMNLILIPILGITGAAIATLLGYFIMMSIGMWKIRHFIDIKLPVMTWSKTLIAGLVFVFIISFLKKVIVLNVFVELAIILAIAGIVYIGMIFILGIIKPKELKSIYSRIAK